MIRFRWFFLLVFASVSCWAQSPIQIEKVDPHSQFLCGAADALSGQSETDPWGSCLRISYRNMSQRRIAGVRFYVNFVSSMKEVDPSTQIYEDSRGLKAGKSLTVLFHDGVFWHQYGDKMGAKVSVAKVMFSDGTFWETPTADMNAAPSVELMTARAELAQQITRVMRSTGGLGYAEIANNVLLIHSERADAERFQRTNELYPRLRILKIARVVYTNDSDKTFTLEVPPN